MTRFFCGQNKVCMVPDPASAEQRQAALDRALHNLRRRYVWVGVLERFEDSLRLLARALPRFFGGMYVEGASKQHVRPANTSAYSMPSRATLAKLAEESSNDVRLYTEATRLLECRLRECAPPAASARASGASLAAPAAAFRGIGPGTGLVSVRTANNDAAARLLNN
jgi:hypothetical protein